jgi:hypothetical protein
MHCLVLYRHAVVRPTRMRYRSRSHSLARAIALRAKAAQLNVQTEVAPHQNALPPAPQHDASSQRARAVSIQAALRHDALSY